MRIIFKKLKANIIPPISLLYPDITWKIVRDFVHAYNMHIDPLHNCKRKSNFRSTARYTELKKQTISVHNPILLSTTPAVFIGHLPW